MKGKIILSLCILILVVVFSTTCSGAEKILFGMVAPMTGDSASFGIQIRNGIQMAVDKINESGGVNGKEFEFIVGDDVANPNQAVTIAQKFQAYDDMLFVLGHNNSGCSIAALPTWEEVNMPLISPSNTMTIITTLGHKNYFRTAIDSDTVSVQLCKLAVIELGLKNVAIIWENTDYGRGMHDAVVKTIAELGGRIVGDESYIPATDRDFSSQITKFKGAKADVVILCSEYTAGALFTKQSRTLGFNAQIIASSGNCDPKYIELAGEAAEGVFTNTGFNPNDQRPKQLEFINAYEALYNRKPGEWASNSYDSVYMAKKAIEMGGTTREKFMEVLHRPDFEYEGVGGLIKFDEFGDVKAKSILYLIVENGRFVGYFPTKY